jgi:hypothetical protein
LGSIALEALEAGVTMFYWKDGRFGSIDIQQAFPSEDV